ncbi:MAG TPA: phosphoenolpyruvate--protein phosphotransferase, partial [Burkholderiaceae bacterium]|nr:phosphoenolpyruvate--protein phosphotransferase [Burkholderiaceae bacterium]
LSDPMLSEAADELIKTRHYNAEWAITTQGQILSAQFESIHDPYLRERGADIDQIIEKVLRRLSGTPNLLQKSVSLNQSEALIVVARDISPADMLKLRDARFAGFLTDLGGPTSHTAIVARSMNVPAVVGLGSAHSLVRDGDLLLIDGLNGSVLVNPSDAAIAEFRQIRSRYIEKRTRLQQLRDTPCITRDGIRIRLEANIEVPDESEAALAVGAEGIGLFRSEFLFMGRSQPPSEDEQYEAYAQVVKAMDGRPVTIRTLDLGADKTLVDDASVAVNPALGLRAIRYCLAHPELFATQLRALLRAATHGHLRILIPLISHMHEVVASQKALQQARQSLIDEGVPVPERVELGAMVETPAIAVAVEPFVDALDFLSIGTNDLIQYTLAIDRSDAEVAHLYDPMHPAVLRLLHHVIGAAHRAGKPVSLCGEAAGDTQMTAVLLGLGLKEFSMHPQHLLDVKSKLLSSHADALRNKVADALNRAVRPTLN